MTTIIAAYRQTTTGTADMFHAIRKMKNKLKILFILLITNVGFAFGNCFGLEIKKLAQSINYPELGYYEDIVLQFKIEKGNFVADSNFVRNRFILYQDIVKEIEKLKIKTNCPDIPGVIRIKFGLQFDDFIGYKNGELIIGKSALAVPNKTYSFYCSDASINHEFERKEIGKKIIKGNNVVFVNYRRNYGNPFIPKEEQEELIYFQIPLGIEEFEYIDKELESLNIFYENSCFPDCGIERIKKGEINGKLELGTWLIELKFKNREFRFNFSGNDKISLSK